MTNNTKMAMPKTMSMSIKENCHDIALLQKAIDPRINTRTRSLFPNFTSLENSLAAIKEKIAKSGTKTVDPKRIPVINTATNTPPDNARTVNSLKTFCCVLRCRLLLCSHFQDEHKLLLHNSFD